MEFIIGNDTYVIHDTATGKITKSIGGAIMAIQEDPFNSAVKIIKAALITINGEFNPKGVDIATDGYTLDQLLVIVEKAMLFIDPEEDKKK